MKKGARMIEKVLGSKSVSFCRNPNSGDGRRLWYFFSFWWWSFVKIIDIDNLHEDYQSIIDINNLHEDYYKIIDIDNLYEDYQKIINVLLEDYKSII